MKKIFTPKTVLSSILIVMLVLAVSGVSHSGNIIVKPGKFDHFSVQVPDKVRAGEGFTMRLQAYDAHENLIADFAESGKDFKVSVTGAASVQPSMLRATSFSGGSAGITVTDKKAETFTLSISEATGTVPVLTREIKVSPNKLDHFFVQAPLSVTAGNNFDVKVIAKDAFDNSITDADIESRNLKMTSGGPAGFKVISAASVFRDGVSVATLVIEKTGETVIEIQDSLSGSRGASSALKIAPASLSHFNVYAPKEAVAGEPFEITISAFDAFNNPIDNYASYGSGVSITTTGQSKPSPALVAQSEFRNGQAALKIRYEKAEEISIIATENNKSQQGKSTPVKINPSSPDNFVVSTPDTAVAGQRFRVKVEAYDRFNNLVKNYNLLGNDVYLNISGTGSLSPKTVSASEFIDGVASVDLVYDKAESFAISASMTTKREEKKVAVKEDKKEHKEIVASAEKQVTSKPRPAEKPRAEKPVQPAVVQPQKAAEKAPKEEEKKTEKKEAVKETKSKGRFFEIKKVSIIEAKNKAMVIINMKPVDSDLEFKDEKGKANGEEWIKVHLRPVVNKTKKSWKFKSAFVKEIRIDEDKSGSGSLSIKVDTLLKQSTFDVSRVKDSLVISISNP